MKLKKSLFSLLALGVLMAPLSLSAEVDFEWRLSLNNRYHADPYGYRYGLADRFRMPESRVIVILDSVREPADAYMIFRLAELSGKPYDYVLSVYRQNRYSSWAEIASLVGIIISSNDFNTLRHRHDLRDDRYDSRRQNRYEDKRVVIKREEIYIPQVYHDQQQKHREPNVRPKEPQRHDARDDRKDDRKNNNNHPDNNDDDRRDGGGRH